MKLLNIKVYSEAKQVDHNWIKNSVVAQPLCHGTLFKQLSLKNGSLKLLRIEVSHATKKVENHWIKYSSSLYLFFYDFSSN
jgi:hypothetical protein